GFAARIARDGHGAQALFAGVVRDRDNGRPVTAVSYDGFTPLAEKILAAIILEAESRFKAVVVAAHRLGTLKVGETSLIVAASSVHRPEAFSSCRYVVDQIKTRLPVWKKEHYADGESRWLEGCVLAAHE